MENNTTNSESNNYSSFTCFELLPVMTAKQLCGFDSTPDERLLTRRWCICGVNTAENIMLNIYCYYIIGLLIVFSLKSYFIIVRLTQNNRHQAIGMILAGMSVFRIVQHFNAHTSTLKTTSEDRHILSSERWWW